MTLSLGTIVRADCPLSETWRWWSWRVWHIDSRNEVRVGNVGWKVFWRHCEDSIDHYHGATIHTEKAEIPDGFEDIANDFVCSLRSFHATIIIHLWLASACCNRHDDS